jgi:hypothetical protein
VLIGREFRRSFEGGVRGRLRPAHEDLPGTLGGAADQVELDRSLEDFAPVERAAHGEVRTNLIRGRTRLEKGQITGSAKPE